MNRVIAFASACALVFSTGCATMNNTFGDAAPVVCAVAGGALGAVVGAIASNHNHGEDDHDDLRRGAGIGGGVGAVGGALLCALTAEETPKTPPSVRATANPSSGAPPLAVDFRCVASSDAGVTGYAWDFGDGSKSTEQNPKHTYSTGGNYNATCTATDANGMTASASAPVSAAVATRKTIVLRGINFDFDRAEIKPEFEGVLDAGADVLKENPGVSVQVGGHADAIGTDEYNQGLSERRANAVRDYLVSKGIEASRLSAVGFGESNPVADNGTDDGRAQNRRVELNIQ